ncbi:MAG: winged helix-turn-helix domain-containing protein [Candidatus Caldarchaeum sp.]
MSDRPIKTFFRWVLLGTRGGPTRLLIILKLRDGPANANQLAKALRLNYKTILHHLEFLIENNLVEADEGRYDVKYRLSPVLSENMDILESVVSEVLGGSRARVSWARSG